LTGELEEERQLNSCLRENQTTWQSRVTELEDGLAKKDIVSIGSFSNDPFRDMLDGRFLIRVVPSVTEMLSVILWILFFTCSYVLLYLVTSANKVLHVGLLRLI